MIPAKMWHLMLSVLAEIWLLWLKVRELVRDYPGSAIAVFIASVVLGLWL
jgi:hypothetical protein